MKFNRRLHGTARPLSVVQVSQVLAFLAPSIEAAGTIQRAHDLGMIGDFGEDDAMQRQLLALVPKSRGGRLDHPDADGDWVRMVESACRIEGRTLQDYRRQVTEMEQDLA